ncbi:MAG: flagellin [Pseudomonadales bacterium]|jgi:flagellin
MSLVINTNSLSMNVQRNLRGAQADLAATVGRLSTGLRINSAKDDAAGLAITERMTTQINGLAISQRNASDGISFVQTAESSLGTMSVSLQRLRELAIQALNDSNTDQDRAAIAVEFDALKEELTRVANTTAFSGRKLLDGSTGALKFQIGADRGQTITVEGADARLSNLGTTVFAVRAGEVAALNAPPGESYESATGTTFSIDGIAIDLSDVSTVEGALVAINEKTFETGTTAVLNGNGGLSFYKEDSYAVFSSANVIVDLYFGFNGGTDSLETRTLEDASVATWDSAQLALPVIDRALDDIASMRATYGATQNRFENVIELASVLNENLAVARSRIRDADFAAETAKLSQLQILQDSGLAALIQANAAPQAVLTLLR